MPLHTVVSQLNRNTTDAELGRIPASSDSPSSGTDFHTVIPIKLETGLRPNSAGIPYTLLLGIEAIGFPTFGLVL